MQYELNKLARLAASVVTRARIRRAERRGAKTWRGYCPVCERRVRFVATGDWYRDQLFCSHCLSIPRERALMHVLKATYPDWRQLDIHESSPAERGVSAWLAAHCPGYIATQYLPDVPLGTTSRGYRSEDLEKQTFPSGVFDIVITQDVFEHLFRPDLAIAEIVRTLRPNGAHIMSVPLVNKQTPSRTRASSIDGMVVHHEPPEYHGNPVSSKGSLVTTDWGYDIVGFLSQHGGPTELKHIEDAGLGLQAEFNDIVITRKRAA